MGHMHRRKYISNRNRPYNLSRARNRQSTAKLPAYSTIGSAFTAAVPIR